MSIQVTVSAEGVSVSAREMAVNKTARRETSGSITIIGTNGSANRNMIKF